MVAKPLDAPPRDPTSNIALLRVQREEPFRRLEVPLSDWCGERLIEAFARMAAGYYAVK